MTTQLEQARLTEHLSYDSETGELRWKKKPNKRIVLGSLAGSIGSEGYQLIFFGGKSYKAHRVAWLLAYGDWPEKQIDHINRVRTDNRLCNLQLATNQENQFNRTASGKSGYVGVYYKPKMGKYAAAIKLNGKTNHLGYYMTAQEASMAHTKAKEQYLANRTN